MRGSGCPSRRHLGGKLGSALNEDLGVATMGQLRDGFSERELSEHFGSKTGRWLFQLARGRDSEPVVGRQLAKSIGCSKTFPGANALDTRTKVTHWLEQLAEEVVERLERDREQNNRVARSLVVVLANQTHPKLMSATRTCALTRYDVGKVRHDAMVLLRPFNSTAPGSEVWSPAVTYLGLSAGKFTDLERQDGPSIRDLFAQSSSSSSAPPPSATPSTPAVPSTSELVTTPSRALTSFERLNQQQQQKAQKEERPAEAAKTEPSGRPSFFERRLKMVRAAEAAKETVKEEAEAEEEKEAEAEAEKEEAEAKKETEAEVEEEAEAEAEKEAEEEKEEEEEAEKEAEEVLLYSESDFMMCTECGARVLIFHMPEHADRHVAEKLHRELQQEMKAEVEGQKRPEERRPGKRRGRPPGSTKAKKMKDGGAFSLDKFLR